jgi:hypothetical protein
MALSRQGKEQQRQDGTANVTGGSAAVASGGYDMAGSADFTGYQMAMDEDQGPQEAAPMDGLSSHCRDLYEEYRSSDYRKKKIEEIEESRKRYRQERPAAKDYPWPGCSNKSLGIDAIVVDTLLPRIYSQLFGDSDFLSIDPQGPEDVEKVDDIKAAADWALNTNCKIKGQMRDPIKDMLMDGTIFLLPSWSEKPAYQVIRTQTPLFTDMSGQLWPMPQERQTPQFKAMVQMGVFRYAGVTEDVAQSETTVFKADIEAINIYDSFWPDTGEDWEDQPFLRMIYPTYEELEEMSEENGGPYKNITPDLITNMGRDSAEEPDTDAMNKGVRHSQYTREVHILECHVPYRGEWWLCSYAVQGAWREVRRQPMREVFGHGRKPVHRLSIFRESNESMGTGLPAKIRHYSTGCDDLYNQMIDCGTVENLPFGFIEWGPGLDDMDWEVAPGKWIPLPPGSKAIPVIHPSRSANFINYIELLLGFMERMVSLLDATIAGRTNASGAVTETYAGMSLLVQESNIKHQFMGESIRDTLGVMVRDILSLYGQFAPFDSKMRIFENNAYVFKPFDLKAIQCEYDVTINVANASANKALNRAEKMELYKILGNSPVGNLVKITQELLKTYDLKDVDNWIKPEVTAMIQAMQQAPELPQVVAQYMQQREQQQREKQIADEAKANIHRREVERQVERPVEDQKIFDQSRESAKRQLLKPAGERAAFADMMPAMQGATPI